MKSHPDKPKVLRYMSQHAGEIIHFKDLARELEIEEKAASDILSRSVRDGNAGIFRVARGSYQCFPGRAGQVHKAEPPPPDPHKIGSVYECVGRIDATHTMAHDETGAMVVVTPFTDWMDERAT